MAQRRKQLRSLGITVVSESGFYTPADLALVASCGAHAVLIGESLVKQANLERAVLTLTSRL